VAGEYHQVRPGDRRGDHVEQRRRGVDHHQCDALAFEGFEVMQQPRREGEGSFRVHRFLQSM
jgi:hypothetical protein